MTWTPERGAIISSPLVAENRIYVAAIQDSGGATRGAVYCLDRRTGKVIWKFDDGGKMQHMYSSPCLAKGRLYIGEGMHANFRCKFYCLDAGNGTTIWDAVTAGHIESSPVVADGKVFFGAGDDGIYCRDAATGEERWHFKEPLHIDTSPVVFGKYLYGGSGVSRTHKTTKIFCLETADGKARWQKTTELPVWGSPTIDGEQVFFGLGNGSLLKSVDPPEKPGGELLCVSAKTGDRLWSYAAADGVLVRPTVDEGHAYASSRDGCCYCIDRQTGRLTWKKALGSPIVTSPVLVDGALYLVASGGEVRCLEAESGMVRWQFDLARYSQTKPRLLSSPSVIREPTGIGNHHLIYLGTELRNPVSSAAVLYCLRD
jgi:outer membrane protein assembly factor BamB